MCCFTPDVTFGYERQPTLFEHLDFGINMESRSRDNCRSPFDNHLTLSMCVLLCSCCCWSKWHWEVHLPQSAHWKNRTSMFLLMVESLSPSSRGVVEGCDCFLQLKGEVRRNHRLRIGVYNQHAADQLELSESPVEYLMVRLSRAKSVCRRYLGP